MRNLCNRKTVRTQSAVLAFVVLLLGSDGRLEAMSHEQSKTLQKSVEIDDSAPAMSVVAPRSLPVSDGWSSHARASMTERPAPSESASETRSVPETKSASANAPNSSARWIKKSAPRSWTATSQKSGTPTIQFLNGKNPVESSSALAGDKTVSSPSAQTPHAASTASANFTQMNAAPSPAQTAARPLTATERFKRALAEQRRAMAAQTAGLPDGPKDLTKSAADAIPAENPAEASSEKLSADTLLGLTAEDSSDLESEDPLRREKAESFLRLKMKILQLKTRQQAAAVVPTDKTQTQPTVNEDPEATPDSVEPSPSNDVKDEQKDGQTGGDDLENTPSPEIEPGVPSAETEGAVPNSDEPSLDENSTETDPESMNEDSASTTVDPVPGRQPVVSGPIDRLGLANNLYAVGEYPTAMELYMESDEAPLTAQQQIWAEYQTANCLRRLGRTSEASNRYRRLAGQTEAGWLSEKANWWVGVLEQIRQLEKSLEEVPETSTAPAPVGVLGPAIPEEVQEPIQP
jgi:hypothetical protein